MGKSNKTTAATINLSNYKHLYESIFNLSADLIIILSTNLYIRDINLCAEKVLGWKKSDVINHSLIDLLKKYKIECPVCDDWNKIKSGKGIISPQTLIMNNSDEYLIVWETVFFITSQVYRFSIFPIDQTR